MSYISNKNRKQMNGLVDALKISDETTISKIYADCDPGYYNLQVQEGQIIKPFLLNKENVIKTIGLENVVYDDKSLGCHKKSKFDGDLKNSHPEDQWITNRSIFNMLNSSEVIDDKYHLTLSSSSEGIDLIGVPEYFHPNTLVEFKMTLQTSYKSEYKLPLPSDKDHFNFISGNVKEFSYNNITGIVRFIAPVGNVELLVQAQKRTIILSADILNADLETWSVKYNDPADSSMVNFTTDDQITPTTEWSTIRRYNEWIRTVSDGTHGVTVLEQGVISETGEKTGDGGTTRYQIYETPPVKRISHFFDPGLARSSVIPENQWSVVYQLIFDSNQVISGADAMIASDIRSDSKNYGDHWLLLQERNQKHNRHFTSAEWSKKIILRDEARGIDVEYELVSSSHNEHRLSATYREILI